MQKLRIVFLLWVVYLPGFAQDSLPKNGPVRFYFPDGNVSGEGMLKDGQPEGLWKSYSQKGTLVSQGLKRKGLNDSIWTFYYDSGIPKTRISYVLGKKEGIRSDFDAEGRKRVEESYRNDVRDGWFSKYHASGVEIYRVRFRGGKEEGTAIERDSTGNLMAWLEFNHGVLVRRQMINRSDRQNRKQGTWLTLNDSLQKVQECQYVNGLLHGYLKTYDARGNLLKIQQFHDGILLPEAQLQHPPIPKKQWNAAGTEMRTGAWTPDGKPTGRHVFTDTSGKTLRVEDWQLGIRVADGQTDSLGLKTGSWKEWYPDGTLKSEGAYSRDLRIGVWKFYFPSGKLEQEGSYSNGKPSATWKWFDENGKPLREERYRNGLEDGFSVEWDAQGDTLSFGEWIDGNREGSWFFRQGNLRIEGRFREGLMDSIWTHRYPNGVLAFRGLFRNGLAEGRHEAFGTDGRLYWEGRYSAGKRVGAWRMFDEEGLVFLRVEYKDGIEVAYEGVPIRPAFESVDYELLLQEFSPRF
jgi:antitoxin component YwqK of YwqJK toxin-antitoxin module